MILYWWSLDDGSLAVGSIKLLLKVDVQIYIPRTLEEGYWIWAESIRESSEKQRYYACPNLCVPAWWSRAVLIFKVVTCDDSNYQFLILNPAILDLFLYFRCLSDIRQFGGDVDWIFFYSNCTKESGHGVFFLLFSYINFLLINVGCPIHWQFGYEFQCCFALSTKGCSFSWTDLTLITWYNALLFQFNWLQVTDFQVTSL